MNKKSIIIIIIVILFFLYEFYNMNIKNEYDNIVEDKSINTVIKENNVKDLKDEMIKIHIYGAINNPGLIEICSGDRVLDAIEKAGGITTEADLTKVNLAYILSDGEKIYIPTVYDEEEFFSMNTNSKLNINTANSEQLQQLEGIGESIANSIIEYRETNGKFKELEDLKNVSGIGESKYNKIKDKICLK